MLKIEWINQHSCFYLCNKDKLSFRWCATKIIQVLKGRKVHWWSLSQGLFKDALSQNS